MLTYKAYLMNNDHLTFEDAADIYERLLKYTDKNDEDFNELFTDMLEAAKKYADVRTSWATQTLDERKAIDASRTIYHNDFMSTLTILARYMKSNQWDDGWLEQIGHASTDRKRLGDFACYIICINALNAR